MVLVQGVRVMIFLVENVKDRVYKLGCRVRSFKFRVSGLRFGLQAKGFKVQASGSRVLGFRVQISGSRVQNAGCRVQDAEFRVYNFGFDAPRLVFSSWLLYSETLQLTTGSKFVTLIAVKTYSFLLWARV